MKTKLLLTFGMLLIFGLSSLYGQSATDNFDSYTVGPLKNQGAAGDGWAGGWSDREPIDVVEGNLGYGSGGKYVTTGKNVQIFRDLAEAWTATGSPVYWLSFTTKIESDDDWGGISLFYDGNEPLYVGNNGGFVSLGDDWNRSPYRMNQICFVLVKIEMNPDGKENAYLWVNYSGSEEPANETAQGKKEFDAPNGFNKIRIGNGGIKISYDNISLSKTSPFSSPISLNGVRFPKDSINIGTDFPSEISVLFDPPYATDQTGVFSSENTAVATVANAVVTGVAAGTTNIIFVSTDGAKRDTVQVKIFEGAVPVDSLKSNFSEVFLFPNGKKQLVATIFPDDANIKDINWTSSNEAVVTVDTSGLVTAVGLGNAIITATSVNGTKTANTTFKVIEPLATEFFNYPEDRLQNQGGAVDGWADAWKFNWVMGNDVVKDNAWIGGGTSGDVFLDRKLVATWPNVAGATYWLSFRYQNLTKDLTATANDPDWGTVSVEVPSGNNMKLLRIGSTKLTGRKIGMSDNWGGTAITEVDDTSSTFIVVKLVMSGVDGNSTAYLWTNPGTEEPVEADAVSMQWWNTVNDGISKITLGVRNPFEMKVSDIRMSTEYTSVEVVAESIVLETANLTLQENKTATLTATVVPDVIYNPEIVWSSTNEAVAKVDQDGVVTAISAGQANIIATTFNGKADTTQLTVMVSTAIETFDSYTVGELKNQGVAENGWAGPWSDNEPISVVEGNLGFAKGGKCVTTGSGVTAFRQLAETWTSLGNPTYWLGFTAKRETGTSWGGLSLFNDGAELLYIGNNGDAGFLDQGNNLVFVLVKMEMSTEVDGSNAYIWVNYEGTTEPDNTTATKVQGFGAIDGFNRIRLGNDGGNSISYDNIKFSKTSFFESNIPVVGVAFSLDEYSLGIDSSVTAVVKFDPPYATTQTGTLTIENSGVLSVDGLTLTGLTAGTSKIFYVATDSPKDTAIVTVSEPSAIHNNQTDNFRIYPIPADEQLNIENTENAVISIMSLNGQSLRRIRAVGNVTTINTSELPTGIYMVKIQKDNVTFFRKIVLK